MYVCVVCVCVSKCACVCVCVCVCKHAIHTHTHTHTHLLFIYVCTCIHKHILFTNILSAYSNAAANTQVLRLWFQLRESGFFIGTSSVTLAPSALRIHICMQCVSMDMFITGPGKKLCAGGVRGEMEDMRIYGMCHTSLECVIHLWNVSYIHTAHARRQDFVF